MNKYYGKFRAIVTSNIDPEQRGRLQVSIPGFQTDQVYWAEACVPFLGSQGVPWTGMNIWVEFEQGDPNYPIWVGCQWDSSFNAR